MVDFYGFHVGKFTVRPMDSMGNNQKDFGVPTKNRR